MRSIYKDLQEKLASKQIQPPKGPKGGLPDRPASADRSGKWQKDKGGRRRRDYY